VFVLRAFVDDDVPGPSDPLDHLRVVEIELALADLETVEKRLNQATRQASSTSTSRRRDRRAAEGLRRAVEGKPLYRAGLKADLREVLEAVLPAHQPLGCWPW
jgi:ribosome-binding ATPase YchF (GTP1/OBG family)